ncbi:MAG TPA: nitrogenase cofactor biosynthesis protein NifB [Desulfobacteria bacterium]|nr:nitrogenase cofactor biosynthesis protein NifB [Desulfobacteria bacterium]
MACGACGLKTEISLGALAETKHHPCFSVGAHHTYARIHLPVAPWCNISCNYCNRKYDCVNESRPGVTSEVLTPAAAQQKYEVVKSKVANLSVVGIAGPGDALANWEQTEKTLKLIRQSDQKVTFCLSTNGLMLPEYAAKIVALGVRHVTVTVNCLDPVIGAQIYKHVLYKGQKYVGSEAAGILVENQLSGIRYLVQHGVVVKVNTVMLKGINDTHIPAVVKKMKELGVFISNIMPLIPASGSVFEHHPQTGMKELNALRRVCQVDLQQMYHCQQCRADAIGLLGEDRSAEFRTAVDRSVEPVTGGQAKQYRIAVTSKYGRLVDQHFGHATEFSIYEGNHGAFKLVEKRRVDQYCAGNEECDDETARRDQMLRAIQDCDAVLTMRIGYNAKERLLKHNLLCVEFCDSVENGLDYTVKVICEHCQEIA